MGPVIDRDEGASATIYPGAGLYVCLTVTADDKLLRDPILGQRVTLKDRADLSVADHRDATRVLEKVTEAMGDEKHDPASRRQLMHLSK